MLHLVFGVTPVTLEALGRYSRADRAAEGHPLGQAAVVAVQQHRRVGMQGVNLQKPWGWHGLTPYPSDCRLLRCSAR